MSLPVIFGLAFAIKRYETYRDQVSWSEWGRYHTFLIEHAYRVKENGDIHPMCLYRAAISGGYIVAEGLAQIKDNINLFRGKKEGRII